MWISRIRVTGGFLNGLDLTLSEGLNVVIGPRGAGKTTLLELLRHALGAQHADHGHSRERQDFLKAVLGTGEVIVDVEAEDGGRHLVVDAKGGGQRTDLSRAVLVLGQNELEEIASDAPSRLNLLDLRMGAEHSLPDLTEASRITGEMSQIRGEMQTRYEESEKRQRLTTDRELLASQEIALLGGSSSQLTEERNLLRIAEEKVIQSNQDLENIELSQQLLIKLSDIQEPQESKIREISDRLESIKNSDRIKDLLSLSSHLHNQMSEIFAETRLLLEISKRETRESNISAREIAAPIRESLDKAEAGLGQITAQLRNIDTELRTLDENDALVEKLELKYSELYTRRKDIFDKVEQEEEILFKARADVARTTTAQIANNVVVAVDHLANYSDFKKFLQDSLKGTKTRSTVIDTVSEGLLPRQLLEFIESNDIEGIAAITRLTSDQSRRLVENLDNRINLVELAKIRLTDSVDFLLNDGAVKKSVDILSTGQKCAVTLPIVLSEQERTLILDQPEDHLDNAYLVKNIVGGLLNRHESGAQTIVATHNANIPVLGSANRVIVLTSDGLNGRVGSTGPFDDSEIVDKITSLMEGGRLAFARRSAFYAEHGGLV